MNADLDRRAARTVIRHLLSDCAECRQVTAPLWASGSESTASTEPQAYDAVFERAFAKAIDVSSRLTHERSKGTILVDELARHPFERARTLVRNSHRFWTVGVCEALLERSFAARFDEPRRTYELACLAAEAAEHLDTAAYGPLGVNDLRARAQAHVGNAQRILGELHAAERSLAASASLLRRGSGNRLDRAYLLAFRAELRKAQRRFPEALRLFGQAASLLRRAGHLHDSGIWLSGKAVVLGAMGEADKAIETLQAAAKLLEPGRDPQIELALRHNLVYNLNEQGRAKEAWEELGRLRPVYTQLAGRMNSIRLRWLEGKVLARLQRSRESEQAFVEVRDRYVREGLAYNAAVVTLDLAILYAERGYASAMKRLAAESLPIFTSLGIHREAIAALLIFQQAAEMEAVSVGLIKELAAYFEKASKNPGLPFRPNA